MSLHVFNFIEENPFPRAASHFKFKAEDSLEKVLY